MKHFVVNAEKIEGDSISAEEAETFFGPLGEMEEIVFSEATDIETLAVETGIFPSKGQARRNGFSGPIPHGIGWLGTKKPQKRFWVWNPVGGETPTFRENFDHTKKWFTEPETEPKK